MFRGMSSRGALSLRTLSLAFYLAFFLVCFDDVNLLEKVLRTMNTLFDFSDIGRRKHCYQNAQRYHNLDIGKTIHFCYELGASMVMLNGCKSEL